MKASLEEDLSRAQVELLNSRRELREREGEAQAWGKEGERLRSEVGALREKVEWLEKERVELREEGEVFETRLQGQAAKMEEREHEWLTEKGELEGKIAKLSQEVEEDVRRVRERLLVVEREREVERSKMAEEKQTWVAERASLREEVSHLSEELEKATAHGRQLEREEAKLREALREAETSSQALQVSRGRQQVEWETIVCTMHNVQCTCTWTGIAMYMYMYSYCTVRYCTVHVHVHQCVPYSTCTRPDCIGGQLHWCHSTYMYMNNQL